MRYLPSGRELDAEIARKVFRYVVMVDTSTGERYTIQRDTGKRRPIEEFSSSSDEAYRIIDLMKANGLFAHIRNNVEDGKQVWHVGFYRAGEETFRLIKGDTLAHATCLAVLDFLGK